MAKKKVKGAKPSFEQSLTELETIVRALEGGELGLADALAQYELGVHHLQTCYALLERAERRIEQVRGIDANGNPVTEPFAVEEDANPNHQADARSRKRTAAGGKKPAGPSLPWSESTT